MKLKLLLLMTCLTLSQVSFAQTVTTIAGPFDASGGVKIGPDSAIYIADFGSSLDSPDGRVVWKYTHEDSLSIFATGLLGASGNDFDRDGNLIQSNIARSIISRIDPQGRVTTFASQGINGPVGVLVDPSGDVFICNCTDNSIRRIFGNGTSKEVVRGRPLWCPNGITQDDDGNIYISNFSDGRVLKLDTLGRLSTLAVIDGGNNGHLTFANDVLYVCSHGDSRIYEVQLDGTTRVMAGSGIRGNKDGNFAEAQFSRPNGIAATPDGDTLYVNSSVPVTNVGRPLNPSLLRMLTGVRNFTLSSRDRSV